jgi:hypothetical protein
VATSSTLLCVEFKDPLTPGGGGGDDDDDDDDGDSSAACDEYDDEYDDGDDDDDDDDDDDEVGTSDTLSLFSSLCTNSDLSMKFDGIGILRRFIIP